MMSKRKLGVLFLMIPIFLFLLEIVVGILLPILVPSMKNNFIVLLAIFLSLFVLSILVFLPWGIVKILNSKSKGTFDIRAINGFSWLETKKRFWILLLFMITYLIINIVLGEAFDTEEYNWLSYLGSFVSLCVSVIFSIGMANIGLKVTNGKKLKYSDLFNKIRYFFHFLGAYILYFLIVLGGFILFIVPGIYRATRFSFYPYLILDRKLNPIKALKESWTITKGKFWDVFAYNLLLGLINILGFICLIVGLLWTVPMTVIARAKMYKDLSE